jgi:LacI family transcriptional regulator
LDGDKVTVTFSKAILTAANVGSVHLTPAHPAPQLTSSSFLFFRATTTVTHTHAPAHKRFARSKRPTVAPTAFPSRNSIKLPTARASAVSAPALRADENPPGDQHLETESSFMPVSRGNREEVSPVFPPSIVLAIPASSEVKVAMSKSFATELGVSAAKQPRRVQFFCDSYLAEVHAGVVDFARAAGWSLYDGKCYDVENTYSEPSDGILTVVARARLFEWLKTQTCPVVQVLSLIGGDSPFPVVETDAATIGVRAAEHFLTLGLPNCIFYRTWLPDGREACWETFSGTLRAAGRTVHRIEFADGRTFEEITTISRQERWDWLAEQLRSLTRPLAAFVMDDRYVNDLVQAAALLKWSIPEELAVLGADNRLLVLGKQPISISSVDSNLHGVGWAGAALLERIMDGEKPPTERVRIAPGEVVARRSTATFVCDHPGVSAAMNFLRSHYHEGIQVADIARAASLSTRSLQGSFKQTVGCTISEELARLRLAHAARLLRETDLKLESVANESGLSSAKYLCEVFRPAFHTTPAAYRESHRAAQK